MVNRTDRPLDAFRYIIRARSREEPAGFPQPTAVGYRGLTMDLSTAYRYNQNMMEYYTCKLTTRAVLWNLHDFFFRRLPSYFCIYILHFLWSISGVLCFRCFVFPLIEVILGTSQRQMISISVLSGFINVTCRGSRKLNSHLGSELSSLAFG